MNDNSDTIYYRERAEQEDRAAIDAVNPLAAQIHRTLASRYRELAKLPGAPKAVPLSVVRD